MLSFVYERGYDLAARALAHPERVLSPIALESVDLCPPPHFRDGLNRLIEVRADHHHREPALARLLPAERATPCDVVRNAITRALSWRATDVREAKPHAVTVCRPSVTVDALVSL